jgi:hypothetical protein
MPKTTELEKAMNPQWHRSRAVRRGTVGEASSGSKARFRMGASGQGACRGLSMPIAARRIIETLGDVIEACLQQQESAL